jgi:hypothetical protein
VFDDVGGVVVSGEPPDRGGDCLKGEAFRGFLYVRALYYFAAGG